MYKKKLFQLLPFSVVIIAIISINDSTSLPVDSTIIWWSVQSFILFGFWLFKKNVYESVNNDSLLVITLFIWWMIFNSLRGIFVAPGYWHYKSLVINVMIFLIPLAAYASTNMLLVQRMLGTYMKIAVPLFILIFPFLSTDAYGFFLIPVSLLLLFLPAINTKWKVLILSISFLVMFIDLSARSNVIKFGVPLLILLVYYFRSVLSRRLLETGRLLLIAAPVIFFVLGITGTFNVFNMTEYIEGEYEVTTTTQEGIQKKIPITADTRTFIYAEVLQTAQKYNSWWIGRSLARGYETNHFKDLVTGSERLRSEAAIPNIFISTGIIGVILYFLIFYRASSLAINSSNNIYCKMLGLFVAFRWCYAWVEDINQFNLNYLLIWMMIGLCFSKAFRNMTNKEVKLWVRGIFSKRYARIWWSSLSREIQKIFY